MLLSNKLTYFIWWLGFFIGFPLFITPSLSIFRGGQGDMSFSLPVGLLFIATYYAAGITNIIKNGLSNSIYLLYLLWVLSAIIIAYPALVVSDASLLAIYLIPSLLSFSFAWSIGRNEDINSILRQLGIGFVTSVTTGAFLHLASSFATYGVIGAFAVRGEFSIFGLFSIYQKFIYYSTTLSIASFLALIYFDGWKMWFAWSILVMDILLCGAREAILLAMIYLLSSSYIRTGIGGVVKILFRLFLVLFFLITFFAFNGMEIGIDDLVFFKKIVAIGDSSSGSDVTAGRAEAINEVWSMFDITPLFVFFGSRFDTIHSFLGTPHNQYVEWFLRGGIIFTLGNIFFSFLAIKNYLMRGGDYLKYGILLTWLMLISNNINTPFRAPYTSIFAWVLIGFGIRLSTFTK